ncbi:Arginine/serine-rich coiled-coil protein [Actinidia chinensis var. chinensis]|uniref:Arginine/serine-rich coiled-coil protein n=1 Tax=Actinidia chinensis var. chinensis TaxID=1590841 RepID=A0A2R6Q4D9_ACTCC|nr:Arginine/serine-rich coiled-coil protein [Actinidia chinensis var. chinensis]
MESNSPSLSPDNADAKAAFRKPSNDASNRKYRRRSPVSGSSSSDGCPKRRRNSSPIYSREDHVRDSDPWRRKDDRRELDKDSGRNHQGRSGDSYRHSGRQSSRGSHNYHRRDEYVRREKYRDDEERNYKSSSRSGRELRVDSQSDHTRRESERYRTRDHLHGDDKYPRDRSDGSGNKTRDKDRETSSVEYQKYKDKDSLSDRAGSGRRHTNSNVEDIKSGERDRHKVDGDDRDEKRDYQRSSGDHKGDFSPVHEESRGHRNDSMSRRESVGHRSKEASKNGPRELDGQKYTKEENKKYDDQETGRHKDGNDREQKNQESTAKRPELFSLGSDNGKDADERQSSSSKQAQEYVSKFTSEQASEKGGVTANDIDAAKVAAMKAAELVNKNLIGTGYMSTDQKKKLLWGNKKNTIAEESGHRWDTTMFSDRERQEKFNKLMGVKGELKVEHKPDNQESSGFEKQSEQLQLDLEKQYTAGLRRRDGRTVGLGL